LTRLVAESFPIVGYGLSPVPGFDIVTWSAGVAFAELTRELGARGCRRFLFLTDVCTPGGEERAEAIRSALPKDGELRSLGLDRSAPIPAAAVIEEALPLLHERWPHAVLTRSDGLAIGILQKALRLGIRVPHDLAVAGTWESPMHEVYEPPLTESGSISIVLPS